MQVFFRFENGPFCLFCDFIFKLPNTSVSYARLSQKPRVSFLFVWYGDHNDMRPHIIKFNSTYPGVLYSSSTELYCLQQVLRSYSYKWKGDAVKIEPLPPKPSTCRLCARTDALSTPSERPRYPHAERARRVDSIVSVPVSYTHLTLPTTPYV